MLKNLKNFNILSNYVNHITNLQIFHNISSQVVVCLVGFQPTVTAEDIFQAA